MPEETHRVQAHSPMHGTVGFNISEGSLRSLMSNAIWQGVVASNKIEGIDLSDLPPPDPTTLPRELLTTPKNPTASSES